MTWKDTAINLEDGGIVSIGVITNPVSLEVASHVCMLSSTVHSFAKLHNSAVMNTHHTLELI